MTSGSNTTRTLDRTPNLALLYPKAVLTGFGRRGQHLPDTTYVRPDLPVDQHHLARYAEVCGFAAAGHLPVTYPHLLAFPLQIRLMSERAFPFALAGLVHVGNHITQHRPLPVDQPLTVSVRAEGLRPHRRGRQFDVISECAVAGQLVWREVSTYLKRERTSPQTTARPAETSPPADQSQPSDPIGTWRVAGDAGRRYAAVSGDRNPIHLHPLTARLFGFPRAIAHGMWTKARCLAAFQDRLPDAYTVDVRFTRPVLLPATVTLTSRHADNTDNADNADNPENPGTGWDFTLWRAGTTTSHLTGRVIPR